MHTLSRVDEFVATLTETGRYHCPECTADRKKQKKTDLQVTIEPDRTLYKCHHCNDVEGAVFNKPTELYRPAKKPEPTVSHIPTPINTNKQIIQSFFKDRGVDASEIDFNRHVVTDKKYFAELGDNLDAIGFVYGIEGDSQAIKWRPANTALKAFTQTGAAKMLYGLQPLQEKQKEIIIVEGEADVIALASIGIEAWSVPNGAPMKVSKGKIDPQEDGKFSYVWEHWDELSSAERIILATDSDTAGDALKQELARRIGLEKCWEIHLPDECKDVTDVLRDKGSDAVKNLFTNTKQMPLKGVYDVDSYFAEVEELYENGEASGISTGLVSIDEIFTVKEGMMYIITGVPGGGKSEYIDDIMVRLAQNHSWKWAVASFENPPATHITKLMEKYTEKPFFKGRSQRISHDEMRDAKGFLNEHFVFLEQKDGKMPTMKDVIAKTKLAIARCGCRGLVIDPYNYIDMSDYEAEHLGISVMLSELSSFARAHDVAVFFVAHPQKIHARDDGSMPIPKGNHISGSAAWWSKADIGITVQRRPTEVEIHCWKARFKWLGNEGKVSIGYNVINGKYFDMQATKAAEWKDFDVEVKQVEKSPKKYINWQDIDDAAY